MTTAGNKKEMTHLYCFTEVAFIRSNKCHCFSSDLTHSNEFQLNTVQHFDPAFINPFL